MLLSLAPSPSGRPWCKVMLPGGYVTFPTGKLALQPGCLSSWGCRVERTGVEGMDRGQRGCRGVDRGQTGCGGQTGQRGCKGPDRGQRGCRGWTGVREGVRDRQGSGVSGGADRGQRGAGWGGCWQPAPLGAGSADGTSGSQVMSPFEPPATRLGTPPPRPRAPRPAGVLGLTRGLASVCF